MAKLTHQHTMKRIDGLTLTVRLSRPLLFRIRVAMLIIRLAGLVGNFGVRIEDDE